MSQAHDHPGEAEPRAHGETHHEKLDIDLNSAAVDELAELPMVGPKRARLIAERRPFHSWEEVARVPGLDTGMIDDLKSGGARLED